MQSRDLVKLLGLSIVLALWALASQRRTSHCRALPLNIPREPLDSALKDFARQTGYKSPRSRMSAAAPTEVGRRRLPYSGEALTTLLGKNPTDVRFLSGRTIAIVNKQTAPPAGATASQLSTDQTAQVKTPDDSGIRTSRRPGVLLEPLSLAQVDQERLRHYFGKKDSSIAQNRRR